MYKISVAYSVTSLGRPTVSLVCTEADDGWSTAVFRHLDQPKDTIAVTASSWDEVLATVRQHLDRADRVITDRRYFHRNRPPNAVYVWDPDLLNPNLLKGETNVPQ